MQSSRRDLSPDVTEVDAIARRLQGAWRNADPDSNVAKHPASYVATFTDMAREVHAMLTEARNEERREALDYVGWHATPDEAAQQAAGAIVGAIHDSSCDDADRDCGLFADDVEAALPVVAQHLSMARARQEKGHA